MRSRLSLAFAACAALLLAGCGGDASAPAPQTKTVASTQRAPAPTPQVRTTPSRAAVPILMYHVIAAAKPGTQLPQLWVPAPDFAAQMQALDDAGYEAVTLTTALDAWRGRAVLPKNPIVVSFDDGYLSQGQEAADTLRKHRWPGVLNLVLHSLGTEGGLSATRIKLMLKDGWELGAHSLTHPDLTTLDAVALQREVEGSRTLLQRKFGVAVNTFCYPAGKYNATVAQAVRDAGYRAATTVEPGAARPGDDRFALPRVRVNAGDSADAVVAAVKSAAG